MESFLGGMQAGRFNQHALNIQRQSGWSRIIPSITHFLCLASALRQNLKCVGPQTSAKAKDKTVFFGHTYTVMCRNTCSLYLAGLFGAAVGSHCVAASRIFTGSQSRTPTGH